MNIGFMPVDRPIQEKNDCVVRAYANATGTGYHDAYARAQALGRRFGRGCEWGIVTGMYAPFGKPVSAHCTVGAFVSMNPTGAFIVKIRKHVFALRNGVIIDIGPPRPRQHVTHYWVVEEGVTLPAVEQLVPKFNEPEYLPYTPVQPRAPQPAFNISALMQRLSTLRVAERNLTSAGTAPSIQLVEHQAGVPALERPFRSIPGGKEMTRRRQLECSCCGGDAGMFVQYHNQDTGYGICAKCVKWQLSRGEDQEQINFRYGIEGVNFAKPEPDVSSL